MKLTITKGTTSKLLRIFVTDSSKTDGSGLTGLVHNTANLTAYYIREGAAATTAITLVDAVVGTYTSSGFKEVDAANMPGVYELHPPNAVLASGADSVLIFMKGAANMAPLPIEIQLDDNTAKDVYDRIGAPAGASIAADIAGVPSDVWDEILTGATHNIATSAGRRVREIGAYAIASGTAQGGNGHSITLAASDTAGDNIYNRNLIVITDNTGVGQTRTIVGYDGTSKVAVVDRDWYVQPDATTEYQITPDDTPLVVDHGIARAGTSTTIQLRTSASAIDDTYHGAIVTILAGTGAGQSKLVDTYDGTTKTATICKTWETTPDTTSVYVLMPYGVSEVCCICDKALDAISDGVWDELQAGHVAAGTFGETATEIADIKVRTDKMRVYGIDQ